MVCDLQIGCELCGSKVTTFWPFPLFGFVEWILQSQLGIQILKQNKLLMLTGLPGENIFEVSSLYHIQYQ